MADKKSGAAGAVVTVKLDFAKTHTVDLAGFRQEMGNEYDVVMLAVPAGEGIAILDDVIEDVRQANE